MAKKRKTSRRVENLKNKVNELRNVKEDVCYESEYEIAGNLSYTFGELQNAKSFFEKAGDKESVAKIEKYLKGNTTALNLQEKKGLSTFLLF